MRRPTLLAVSSLLCACATADVTGDGGAGVDGPPASPDADPGAPDAASPDAMVFDAQIAMRSFTVDTEADFAGGTMTDATVEPWGALAPIAYYTGGLVQRASDTQFFTDGTTATWAEVMGYTPTGKTAISWLTSANWAQDTPPSVGLTSGEDWTQWYEGEIWLAAGAWSFAMLVDDHGFVEIAPPGSTTFQRVVSANWATESTGAFTATADGWYPFRYAIVDQAVDAQLQLRFTGPGVALQPIPRDRFRARTDQLTGLVEAGFDDSRGVGDVDTTIDTVGPGNTDWNVGNPGDLGMTASDTFSVRWTGQFRVDVGGTFTFRYVTDDGQRLWIDGTKLIDAWTDTTNDNTTGGISLAAGWHDVVIEQSENGGGAAAFLTIASGPELVGQPLPVARLRPVEGRADRLAAGVNRADLTLPDLVTSTETVAIAAPSNAIVASVDVAFQFTHTYKGDMTFSLRAPNGQQVQIVDFVGAGNGTYTERYTVSGWTATPANGTWTFVAQDAATGDTGTLLDVEITPHYTGGDPPIPATAVYESAVRDLLAGGGMAVTAIDTISWAERVPSGADVAIRVRTCATIPACATATYSAPLTASPGTPVVPAGRYLQYRVDFTSNGDRAPALESLTLAYRVAQ